jgi:hypothetical protein
MAASKKRVAEIARRSETMDVDTNNGIRSTSELIERATKGDSIAFDYARLIEESRSYE